MKKLKTLFLTSLACLLATASSVGQTTPKPADKTWWKEAVVYQIYPRSFQDSNGDGVGDLKGVISKLDYIKSLGVDVIWLNPIFESPNADNGYDISNYRGIMKEFGTMADFDALLKGMHERGIKLLLDLVVNHSSDEHEWFKQSRSSRTNPYRDYYHWWPAEKGKPAFRPGAFEADGSGWRYDSLTNAYYLHYFNFKQPDLNWENPKVRAEVFDMMKFWLDKGIDGFRMDVIPFISKDVTFPIITQKDLDEKYHGEWGQYIGNGPFLHQYLKEMNAQVLSKYDCMSVAEGAGVTSETAHNFVDAERKELNMLYHFEGMGYGQVPGKFRTPDPKGYDLVGFKKIYSKWDSIFATKGWGTIYLGNHDQPRMATRWGNDAPEYSEVSSKMLTTFLLTMRATPYYYFGDELGMTNIKFDSISQYKDIETLAMYQMTKNKGGDLQDFLNGQKMGARDNGRTPFQWDATENAGFTTGTPWIKINDNHNTVNESAEEKDSNSCLNYFRKMVQLRKNNKTLVYGKYTLLDKNNPQIYAYTRGTGSDKILVLLNFSRNVVDWKITDQLKLSDQILINNYPELKKNLNIVTLNAYQAVCVKLK